MYCANCGDNQPDYAMYCSVCGGLIRNEPLAYNLQQTAQGQQDYQMQASYSASGDWYGQQQHKYNSTVPLRVVPYKGGGRNVYFYEDHLEFDGNYIRYSDIAVMDSCATSTFGYAAIIWYAYTTMYIRFTLHNGQKYKINAGGMSVCSIGTTRSSKKRWPALYAAMYEIVAKEMAENALSHIQNGATVNLAGLEINREYSLYKKMFRQQPVCIDRRNFGACGNDGYAIRVVDRNGQKLFRTSDDDANALLLPYVLNTLYAA